jgi:plasmid stability protein
MAQLLVRNLDEEMIKRLKMLAKRHNRSLQGQVKLILEEGAMLSGGQVMELVEKWQRRLGGKRLRDSAVLIREDRER